jgi:hypothetical protein
MCMPFRLVALATAVSMVATPVAALDLPTGQRGTIATGASDANGWGRHRRHRGGIDAGDVVAGVLVLGAIAAIAGAADSDNDRRRQRAEPYREPMREPARGYQSSRGIDSAVGMCVDQIERGSDRVDSVDNAARTADGWRVSGALDSGAGWNCWIDNDGRVRSIDFAGDGERFGIAPPSGGQLSDDAYAQARAAQRGGAEPQPAYPGGPLPGEDGYEEALLAAPTA